MEISRHHSETKKKCSQRSGGEQVNRMTAAREGYPYHPVDKRNPITRKHAIQIREYIRSFLFFTGPQEKRLNCCEPRGLTSRSKYYNTNPSNQNYDEEDNRDPIIRNRSKNPTLGAPRIQQRQRSTGKIGAQRVRLPLNSSDGNAPVANGTDNSRVNHKRKSNSLRSSKVHQRLRRSGLPSASNVGNAFRNRQREDAEVTRHQNGVRKYRSTYRNEASHRRKGKIGLGITCSSANEPQNNGDRQNTYTSSTDEGEEEAPSVENFDPGDRGYCRIENEVEDRGSNICL
ncbi:unnamed protein product [Agarophyton chilense]